MFTFALAEAVTNAKTLDQIDKTNRLIWSAYGEGLLNDEEAQRSSQTLQDRKNLIKVRLTQKGQSKVISANSRPHRNTERIRRRRTWSASGQVPASIACHYTPGQAAALAVIVSMLRNSSVITKTLQEIGDLAGVCRKTVQRTLALAKTLGHLQVQERRVSVTRNLPHRITALDPLLRQWIANKPVRWTNGSSLKKHNNHIDSQYMAKTKVSRNGLWQGQAPFSPSVTSCTSVLESPYQLIA